MRLDSYFDDALWGLDDLAAFSTSLGRDAMREFVNDLLSGDIPHCHLLLASRLIALEKPQGGVRPIAIGEAFLRLASVLCRPHRTLQTCSRPSRLAWVSRGVRRFPGIR